MMIVVTQENRIPAAINTEKIIWVEGFCGLWKSSIYCNGCEPLKVLESPEEIAAMCNQNQY